MCRIMSRAGLDSGQRPARQKDSGEYPTTASSGSIAARDLLAFAYSRGEDGARHTAGSCAPFPLFCRPRCRTMLNPTSRKAQKS